MVGNGEKRLEKMKKRYVDLLIFIDEYVVNIVVGHIQGYQVQF